jgi:hypothetical protein
VDRLATPDPDGDLMLGRWSAIDDVIGMIGLAVTGWVVARQAVHYSRSQLGGSRDVLRAGWRKWQAAVEAAAVAWREAGSTARPANPDDSPRDEAP